jgi:hypothetical protein
MKDGDGDHRDQIVALDRICDAVRRAGLAVAALLSEAAGWSITRGASAPDGGSRLRLVRGPFRLRALAYRESTTSPTLVVSLQAVVMCFRC